MNRIEIIMSIKEMEKSLLTLTDPKDRWRVVEKLIGLETKLIKFDNRLVN